MSQPVIRLENVSKLYRIGEMGTGTISNDLSRWWSKTVKGKDPFAKIGQEQKDREGDFWALKDINFEVNQGDVLGIIGKNGAGKSTLLKILSRITSPTTGQVKIKGRIASLLEVGTGFHPELTGRDNVYLNGSFLGMKKWEIDKRFDEIIDFSGIEKFIDTPVKRYSSGMYVRLAFAVAAHLDPEILIIDEVLAVGDAEFQKKCLGKMKRVSTEEGRTVIFVSHDMQSIANLTKTAVFLESGNIRNWGETESVIRFYIDNQKDKSSIYRSTSSIDKPKIVFVELETTYPNNVHLNGKDLIFRILIETPKPIQNAWISIQISDSNESNFVHVWTNNQIIPLLNKAGKHEIFCKIPEIKLYMGKYFCNINIAEPPGGEVFETLKNICPLEIVMYDTYREYTWQSGSCAYIETSIWKSRLL